MSVLTAAEEIALLLLDEQPSADAPQFDIDSEFVKLLGEAAPKIQAYDLSGKTEQQVEDFISQQLSGKEVQKLTGQDIQKVHGMMSMSHKRVRVE